jgi:hypothetical protein
MHGYESELLLHVIIGREFFQGSHFVHAKSLNGQEIGSGLSDNDFISQSSMNSIMILI